MKIYQVITEETFFVWAKDEQDVISVLRGEGLYDDEFPEEIYSIKEISMENAAQIPVSDDEAPFATNIAEIVEQIKRYKEDGKSQYLCGTIY
jgi:hypothetical protein